MKKAKKILWILWKDIITQFRSREVSGAMVLFALIVIVIFAFSFIQPGQKTKAEILPGMIWVTVSFAGMLGLNHTFLMERTNDSLLGLLLAPVGKDAIYLGKVGAHLISLLLVELISLPLFYIFFNVRPQAPLPCLLLVIFLGSLGFSGAGVFMAAISDGTSTRETLLPVLLFPVIIPLLIGAVKATAIAIAGPWPDPLWVGSYWSWVRLMAVFDIILFSASVVLIDYVLEV